MVLSQHIEINDSFQIILGTIFKSSIIFKRHCMCLGFVVCQQSHIFWVNVVRCNTKWWKDKVMFIDSLMNFYHIFLCICLRVIKFILFKWFKNFILCFIFFNLLHCIYSRIMFILTKFWFYWILFVIFHEHCLFIYVSLKQQILFYVGFFLLFVFILVNVRYS